MILNCDFIFRVPYSPKISQSVLFSDPARGQAPPLKKIEKGKNAPYCASHVGIPAQCPNLYFKKSFGNENHRGSYPFFFIYYVCLYNLFTSLVILRSAAIYLLWAVISMWSKHNSTSKMDVGMWHSAHFMSDKTETCEKMLYRFSFGTHLVMLIQVC